MQWYLIKTWVGKEEEMVKELHRIMPPQMYTECFVIYQERIWRKQKRSIVHVEPLFPGCVFLTCMEPAPLFCRIEQIPSVAVRISCGSLRFFPMTEEDGAFLERISGNDHIVKLSHVRKDDEGRVCTLSEPLKTFQGQIERMQVKKRYAMVRHRLWGENQVFVLGIVLKEDEGINLIYPDRSCDHDRKIPLEAEQNEP